MPDTAKKLVHFLGETTSDVVWGLVHDFVTLPVGIARNAYREFWLADPAEQLALLERRER